ncbi:MAG TPA: hypothetical protein DGR27_02345 [Eubacterium sp.]|nr:hypothetical protein [Eubacterium sp.]HCW37341.1 hypothetical protein [Eubacterium sp.]
MLKRYSSPPEPVKKEKSQSEIFMEDDDFVMTQLKRHVLILQNRLTMGMYQDDVDIKLYHQAIIDTLYEIEKRKK